MTLTQANTKIIETLELLGEKIPRLEVLEGKYQERYNQLMLGSQRASQAQREAEALESLRIEEVYEQYHSLKVEVRVLLMRKEGLYKVSDNLRTLSYGMSER